MFPEVLSNSNSMAFLISKFYYIKDINSSNIDIFESAIHVTSEVGDGDLNDSFTGAPCHLINKIDKECLESVKKSYKENKDVALLVAVLEYPYIVRISNTPNLSLYLKGIFDDNTERIPRLLFNITKTGKEGIVLSEYAFKGDKVYVLEDRKTKLSDLIADKENDENSDIKIFNQIEDAVDRKEGTYELIFKTIDNIRYEVICITISGEEDKKIEIKLNCEKQYTPRAMPHDLYKYYCFENEDDKSKDDKFIWAFRYKKEERKKDRPLFVFDDESELPKL